MVKKLFIFLILLFSLSIVALQMSFVQVPLLNFLMQRIIQNPNVNTSYGKIHGFFPISFTLENFSLDNNTKKILELENLKISLNPKKESFYIDSINCDKFTVYKNIDQMFKDVNFTDSSLPMNSKNIFPWTGNIAYSSLSPQTDQLVIQKINSKKNSADQNPFIIKINRELPKNKIAKYQIDIQESGIFISKTPINFHCSFTKDSKGLLVFTKSTILSKAFAIDFQGHYMSKGKFFHIDFNTAFDLDTSKKIASSGSLKKLKKTDHLHLDLKALYTSFGKDKKIIQNTNFDINTHFLLDLENKQASLFSIHIKSPIPVDIISKEGILISQEKMDGTFSVLGFGIPLNFVLKGHYEKASQLLNLSLVSDFQNEVLVNLQSKIDLLKQNMDGQLQFQTKTIPATSLHFKISEEEMNKKFFMNINSKEIQLFSTRLIDFQSNFHFNTNETFDLNINAKINNVASNPVSLAITGAFESKDISIKTLQLSYLDQIIKNIHAFKVTDITSSPVLSDLKLISIYNGQSTGQIEWGRQNKKILFKNVSLLNLKTVFEELPFSAEIDGFIDLSPEFNLQDYTRIIDKSSISISNFAALNGISQPYKSILLNKKITLNISQDSHNFKLQLLGYDHLQKHNLASGTIEKITSGNLTSAPIHIHLKGDADINPIVSFLKVPDTIEGILLYDLKCMGSISQPTLNGTLKIKNGLYESFINGTYLAHLNGDINVKDNLLTIKDIRGDDIRQGTTPSNGSIHITGKSTIHSYKLIENHLMLKLSNLLVVKRDDMEMKATGVIKLDGENERTKITGSVALDPAVIWLEELTNDDITSISLFENGKRVFVTSAEINSKRIKNNNNQVLFPIDLELSIPQSLQLKGLGMTSTWKGILHVKGDFLIDVPYLVGSLKLINGSIMFYGKKLKLADGSIVFDQKSINNPYLQLIMMRQIAGQKLFINMLGRTTSGEEDSLHFTFSADPSETDKNVLSLMIFGKRTNQITAGQSIHLASIATSIANKDNENSSVMDKLKSGMGLDVFEIKENAREAQYSDTGYTQKQVLSVGKDFNDFKVTFNQGIGDMDTKATISKPIGPYLNIDIDVGNQVAGSGGGISWIYHY